MITRNRIKTVLTLAVLAMALLGSVANAVVIALTPDEAASTSTYAGTVADTLSDPFEFDPDNPTSPMPAPIDWYEGTDAELARIVYTFTAVTDTLVVDLYGRRVQDWVFDRDDHLAVDFYYLGSLVETVAGDGLIDSDDFHGRLRSSPGTFDEMHIRETNEVPSNFAILETRVSTANPLDASVDAGVNKINWSDKKMQLAATVVNNDLPNALIFAWTADPNDSVVFDPQGSDPWNSTDEDPQITITRSTDNPTLITLTLTVSNENSSRLDVSDAMTIKLYDDTCAAALGAGGNLAQGDITDDCITNLDDIGELSAAWDDDYTITAPVPKP